MTSPTTSLSLSCRRQGHLEGLSLRSQGVHVAELAVGLPVQQIPGTAALGCCRAAHRLLDCCAEGTSSCRATPLQSIVLLGDVALGSAPLQPAHACPESVMPPVACTAAPIAGCLCWPPTLGAASAAPTAAPVAPVGVAAPVPVAGAAPAPATAGNWARNTEPDLRDLGYA